MKRSEVLAKLDTYRSLRDQSLVTDDILRESIQKSIAEGSLKALPLSAFEKEAAELLAFAQAFGLVKTVKEEEEGNGRVGAGKLVGEQYPEYAAAVAALEPLKGKIFQVEHEGKTVLVQFQPFWRTVKPKEVVTATEGTHTV